MFKELFCIKHLSYTIIISIIRNYLAVKVAESPAKCNIRSGYVPNKRVEDFAVQF